MRDKSIDLAKGIGIILVVIGHSINGKVEPGIFIGAFHMPLFFFLSGVCFNFERHCEFKPFLRRRLRTLLWPAIVFTAIIYAVSHLLLTRTAPDPHRLLWEGFYPAMWFLGVLFCAELLYWAIYRFSGGKANYIIASAVVCILLAFVSSKVGLCNPYRVFTTFAATAFYAAGHLLRQYVLLSAERFGFVHFLSICVVSAVACMVITHLIQRPIGMSGNYVTPMTLPGAVFGILSVVTLCKVLIMRTSKWLMGGVRTLCWLGRNTLVIMAVHMYFISISVAYLIPLFPSTLAYKLVEQLFVWALCIISVLLVNRYARWLIGKC